jgi:hypothetical protein
MNIRFLHALPLVGLLMGCGPRVSEVRQASAPPRPENCDLEFLQLKMEDLAPGSGTYEVLGSVILQETGIQDPMQPKYREIVRPRACAMGGEGITILLSSSSAGPLGGGGSGTVYSVVRKRPAEGAAPPPPTKF